MSENILSVQNLHTSFHTDKGEVKAVNGVTFNLEKGKILGIVGESGSGKSVTAYSIMRILEKERPHHRRQNPLLKDRILQNFLKSRCGSSVENAVLLFSRIP